jgi:hypothetical protein
VVCCECAHEVRVRLGVCGELEFAGREALAIAAAAACISDRVAPQHDPVTTSAGRGPA